MVFSERFNAASKFPILYIFCFSVNASGSFVIKNVSISGRLIVVCWFSQGGADGIELGAGALVDVVLVCKDIVNIGHDFTLCLYDVCFLIRAGSLRSANVNNVISGDKDKKKF